MKNLVIKYSEFGTKLEIEPELRKSLFFKRHMLTGVLDDFVDSLNETLEAIKDENQSIDRFSMLFLLIGFVGITVMATVIGYLYNLWLSFGLVAFYVVTLIIIFYRNNRQLLHL